MSGGDGQPETLVGVTVTLGGEHAMGETMETAEDGGFAFTGLRAGTYTVTISDFPEDISFETVSVEVEVEVGEVGNADFTGHYIRTSAVAGQVIIEGEGLAGVTVTLAGGPADESYTMMTDADGMYRFEDLRPGDYTVSISDFDTRDYEFAATSQDVSVDLDETGTVSFTGVLLRTSGISGRVSVEGMGLPDVVVTLSGAADDTTMTDASGQYAFAGLAAGDYTVSIAVDDPRYVFDEMSKDRTVGDDDSQIVSFEGLHDTSATLTAMLFIDEASKNDTYDEGDEDAFPSAAMLQALQAAEVQLPPMLPVPVTLVGPVVNEVRSGVLNLATGQISFSGLREGDYELRVGSLAALLPALPPAAAAVLRDYEYGGPTGGYEIAIGVGDQATQAIPVDITHTTVHFMVTLKSGEDRGTPPIPVSGATVTLSSGDSGPTGDNGMAMIRFAREGTSGNMVTATVAAEGYHVAEGTTAVAWDPKSPYTQATNANDIVNLTANFSFKGATLGGDALAGWAISVTSGDDAVAGAPAALGDDGSASFSETLGAGDLPKTYTIAVADDQEGKDADGNELDGGEKYESTPLEFVHNGLMLAGGDAADAGALQVTYTTQTLNVYVHHERDQVMGYTGNVLGDDVRMSGMLDVEVRYVQNGYRHQFTAADSLDISDKDGVYTFAHVPADKNVIVTADKASDTLNIMVIGQDEVTASGFGAQGGGSHHTVDLCSLASVEGQQRHDECATFAFVHTYAVDGQAWKNVVSMSSDDFVKDVAGNEVVSTEGIPGFTVNMDPVEGENLANESADPFEAEKKGDKAFDFGQMPAGVYTVSISGDTADWKVQRGPADDPTDDLMDRISPLDSALNIDVSPKTGYVFGTVSDDQGRRAAGVSVDVNGESAVTDAQGRYVVEGFGPASYKAPNAKNPSKNRSVVRAFDPGQGAMMVMSHIAFAANAPKRVDFSVAQATDIAMVSGRVTHSGTGAGVAGVEIMVDYGAGAVVPLNATYHTVPKAGGGTTQVRMLRTGADGSYTAHVTATGGTVSVSAKKEFMFFTPDKHTVSAVVGAQVSGINFSAFDNGTITGRVVDGADPPNAISGVIVSATATGATSAAHADTTGATGTYVLRVPYGTYTVSATKNGHTFSSVSDVSVPNDGRPIDNIVGTADQANADLSTLHLSGVTLKYPDPADATKMKSGFKADVSAYTATVGNSVAMTTVTATAAVAGASRVIDPGDASSAAGHQVELELGANVITVTVTPADGTSPTKDYTVTVTRRAPSTMIEGTVTDANGVGIKDVVITVGGEAPLNATGSPKALKTDTDGNYSAEVESTGAAATVMPSKDGLTFSPASRSVTLTAGATITGIDFEGSGNASIRGRVVDENGAGLAGAMVTASPRGGTGGPSATTRSSGTFTITNVPLGWTTVTVAKDGYNFAPRDVYLTGGTVDIGDLQAGGTTQPTNVEAARDKAADGSFDGNVTVTWAAGGTPLAAGTYQAQSCVPADEDDTTTTPRDETMCDNNPDNVDNWSALGSTVAFDATELTVTATVPTGSDNGFSVRVQANDGATPPVIENSAVESVAGINAAPSMAEAMRDIDPSPDNLVVKWDGDRAGATVARVIGGFTTTVGGTTSTTWVVLSTVDFTAAEYSADDETKDHQWTFAFESTTLVTAATVVDPATGVAIDADEDDTADTMDLTAAMMNGEFMVRVQARHPGIDFVDENDNGTEDTGEEVWNASNDASVGDKQ
ncbi:MAG: carboxypeptidase regulatory-like domain-containing protein [Gemmatimonadota bacterium]|nr:carboxypeptidase regulatory-like domain-containing protein [Gemmatimonadota bacterium]